MKTLALTLLIFALGSTLPAQTASNGDIQRAVEGAIRLQRHFKNPSDLVLDSVTLAPGKHGNDACYGFHSRDHFDVIAPRSNNGIEINTADYTAKGQLHIWPVHKATAFHQRPCAYNRANATDVTKEVREAGGFLP